MKPFLLLAAALFAPAAMSAQSVREWAFPGRELLGVVSPHGVERDRLDQIAGAPEVVPTMLRSLSAIVSRTQRAPVLFGLLPPELQIVDNSALPWSNNDGALWAGRGTSKRVSGGFFARLGRVQVVIAPEFTSVANDSFELRKPIIERPPIPPDRSPYAFPWYVVGPYSIDMPTRFGDESMSRLGLGQSSILVGLSSLELGFANENEWWGPGISNALVLSTNAPGFPHYFLRSARPLATVIGEVDFRWLVGGLSESDHFDTLETNDLRSLSAAAVTLRLRRPAGLTVGAARSVWGTSTGWSEIPLRWMEVFRDVGRPNDRPLSDSTLNPGGRDQLYSLFARWVFPAAGLEIFTEWGRTELPVSFRDLLVSPNHTQAYTIGFQWRRPGWRSGDFWRVHAENTNVEQSATFRDRPLGVWYTSRRVIQGYTNRGQPLGAAVGPGSSGQNLRLDYMRLAWSLGLEAGRTRYNEDVRSISPIYDFKRWCTHDINLYWGVRGASRSRFGLVALDYTLGNRIQPWFQVQSGCPRGDAMVDIRNNTLRLTFSPLAGR